MSANIKDEPGHKEHLDKRAQKQFPNAHVNKLISKIIEKRQKDEYLRTSKYSEGLCFWCDEYRYVLPTLAHVCFRCTQKKNKDAILAVASKDMYGYCYMCNKMSKVEFRYNIAQLNVRMCDRCGKKLRYNMKHLKRGGTPAIDPFWKYTRKRLGKDFKAYFNPNSVSRDFWKR